MIEWLLWPGVALMVASRVVGETGIPPIGAIGKVSQLTTGMTAPGEMTATTFFDRIYRMSF